MIVAIDLDGTLFDDRHRKHLAEAHQWDEYHSRLDYDLPVKPLLALLDTLCKGDAYTIGITGRTERWRPHTMAKLIKHDVCLNELWMRPDDDFTKAPELKVKLLQKMIEERTTDDHAVSLQDAIVVIDDRDDICQAMRTAGIFAMKVEL